MGIDYKQAGVDIEQGDALVDWLKNNQPKSWPHQERLVGGLGGFSALFRADFKDMQEPCLVSCTDGVGTKLKVAIHFNSHSGVGQDLVAMCVNDLLCVGAQPLFFLDYYATGKLDNEVAKDFLAGVQAACLQSDLALIGGETAEMPGVYGSGDYDCAGFCVGVVDRPNALGAHNVKSGDALIGLKSSGFHSNGFSLIRKLFENDFDAHKDILLEPTALYVETMSHLRASGVKLHAVANITGGGLDNILRVLPEGTAVDLKPWKVPAPFMEVKKRGEMKWEDLLKTLNCGLGMVLILPASEKEKALEALKSDKCWDGFDLGTVVESSEKTWNLDEDALSSMSEGGH